MFKIRLGNVPDLSHRKLDARAVLRHQPHPLLSVLSREERT